MHSVVWIAVAMQEATEQEAAEMVLDSDLPLTNKTMCEKYAERVHKWAMAATGDDFIDKLLQ
jgi:hypothetical protein